MSENKILIAAPIGDSKEYSINEWFKWISEQAYENYDVCVCVNGNSKESIKKKVEMLKQVEINNRKIIVLELDYSKYYTIKYKIPASREIIRKYAIKQNYDYIFWSDTDTIPVILDAIPKLLKHKKGIISGLYFYKETKQPIVLDLETNTNMNLKKIRELAEKKEICKVWGFGFGCVLVHKSVFEKVVFDYKFMKERWTEDFQYCEFMARLGLDRWFDPQVVCKHFSAKDFTITE